MTIASLSEFGASTPLRADVCIAGAGAAGISLALELERRGLTTIVLESGRRRFHSRSQELYAGRGVGLINDHYVKTSRTRQLGGTTNRWLGWCRPLDPNDLEEREWVPHSGWPIEYSELAQHYPRAAELCGVPWDFPPMQPYSPEFPALLTHNYQVAKLPKFAALHGKALASSDRCRVLLDANLVGIDLDDSQSRITSFEAKSFDRPSLRVRADHFVLALGGIETPRVMLACRGQHEGGLGNERDLVGRFFADHPVTDLGKFIASDSHVSLEGAFMVQSNRVAWTLSPEEQRARRLLNAHFTLLGDGPEVREEFPDGALEGGAKGAGSLTAGLTDEQRRLERPPRLVGARFGLRPEPRPNPANRVLLSEDRDELGMPRARVEWSLDEEDLDTLFNLQLLFAEAFARLGIGRMQIFPRERLFAAPGYHHMGSTRMSRDPGSGVVDADCRVHDVDNLFIAGSSVFPTYGYANPTLTLIALAVRLSERLAGSKTRS